MKIEFLKLLNFRNYKNLSVSFHSSLNIIYGKNGSGKTNLVEGIYVLALTKSFRATGDKTLLLDGASVCKIEGNVNNRFSANYRIYLSKDGKKVKINQTKIQKLSDYISKIAIVLFHPDDLRFIKDTPSTRRKNLNISISLMNTLYLNYLNQYNKLLKQRNAYLKQMIINHNQSSSYLHILNNKLIDMGYFVYEKRKEYVDNINTYLNAFYKRITGSSGLRMQYISFYDNKTKEEIDLSMQNNLKKELMLGKTLLGVHTDDLKFTLNGKDLKDYGSEGQQKNAIIAYKFSELELFKEKKGVYPILILDDLFSELDEEKITNILGMLSPKWQTFITTTDLKIFSSLKDFSYKQIKIQDGMIVEESEHGRE